MTQRKILMMTASMAWLAAAAGAHAEDQKAAQVDDIVVTGSRAASGSPR